MHFKFMTEIKGAVLSDKEILEEQGKDVIIFPFNSKQVGPNSYDITIGEYYYERQFEEDLPEVLNPFSGEHLCKFWGNDMSLTYGAKQASIVEDIETAVKYDLNIGDKYILIKPGHVILAHTNEFIGSRGHITSAMHARSSIGRSSLVVCSCAGLNDVGYFNRLTYEIKNRNPIPVILRVGSLIAQIVFMRTGDVIISYEKRGQYQTSSDLQEVVSTWTPNLMIPRQAREYAEEANENAYIGKRPSFTSQFDKYFPRRSKRLRS